LPKVECCYDLIPSYMTGRSHSFAHILLPMSEMLYLRMYDTDYWLSSDHIVFVPPDTFHRVICSEKFIWFNIPKEMVDEKDAEYFAQNPVFSLTDTLRPLIALIRYEISIDADSDALRYLFYYLYAKLKSSSKLKSVRYMEEHFAEHIDIKMLAQMENYNPTYYIGWFKEKTGQTPNDYLNRLRIEKAKELLINTRYRIIDIALQAGYANGSTFARAFKGAQGQSPGEFRQKNRVNGEYSKLPYWQKPQRKL